MHSPWFLLMLSSLKSDQIFTRHPLEFKLFTTDSLAFSLALGWAHGVSTCSDFHEIHEISNCHSRLTANSYALSLIPILFAKHISHRQTILIGYNAISKLSPRRSVLNLNSLNWSLPEQICYTDGRPKSCWKHTCGSWVGLCEENSGLLAPKAEHREDQNPDKTEKSMSYMYMEVNTKCIWRNTLEYWTL